jgi:hypothetical protein
VVRLLLALVVLLFGIGILPSAAAAAAGHGAAHRAPATVEQVPDSGSIQHLRSAEPHEHMPGTHGCRYAAGCSGVGSAENGTPAVPLPRQVAAAPQSPVVPVPHGADLPREDRPPRPV